MGHLPDHIRLQPSYTQLLVALNHLLISQRGMQWLGGPGCTSIRLVIIKLLFLFLLFCCLGCCFVVVVCVAVLLLFTVVNFVECSLSSAYLFFVYICWSIYLYNNIYYMYSYTYCYI